jgi:hypothetical protein
VILESAPWNGETGWRGMNRNISPSSSEGNENIIHSTKVRSGRSQESQNVAQDELTALVALVHELKLAGADQWDTLGQHHYCPNGIHWGNNGSFVQSRLVASALITSSQSRSLQDLPSFPRFFKKLSRLATAMPDSGSIQRRIDNKRSGAQTKI